MRSSSDNRMLVIIGIVIGGVFLVLIVALICIVILVARHRDQVAQVEAEQLQEHTRQLQAEEAMRVWQQAAQQKERELRREAIKDLVADQAEVLKRPAKDTPVDFSQLIADFKSDRIRAVTIYGLHQLTITGGVVVDAGQEAGLSFVLVGDVSPNRRDVLIRVWIGVPDQLVGLDRGQSVLIIGGWLHRTPNAERPEFIGSVLRR